jgi:DNA invertase Pin-like site-specific DNA recombinase
VAKAKARVPAVSYLRVSGRGQVAGDGFPRQRLAVERFAKRNGFALIDEYRDEGVSGTTDLPSRPGLAALLDRIEANGVRVVLVERADRLARDLLVSEWILRELAKHGVRVLDSAGTCLTDAETTDPTTTLIRQVLGSVAQFDKSVTVAKLAAARARIRARVGVCEGRKAFGFYEGEAETVALIARLRRKPRGRGKRSMSFSAIADELNARHVPTRTGSPWHWSTVRKIHQRPGKNSGVS